MLQFPIPENQCRVSRRSNSSLFNNNSGSRLRLQSAKDLPFQLPPTRYFGFFSESSIDKSQSRFPRSPEAVKEVLCKGKEGCSTCSISSLVPMVSRFAKKRNRKLSITAAPY